MPIVNIRLARRPEPTAPQQKAALIAGITELMHSVLDKRRESVVVVIDEVDPENWGEGGEPVTAIRARRTPSLSPLQGSAMPRQLISSGSPFEADIGYSRAVVAGDWVFVSGTTGFDYATMTIADDVVAQAGQALRNIEAALMQAGSSLRDVVRVTYVLPNAGEFERCWPVLRQHLGEVRPAAMMISAGLADPRMKIEIEVTALKGSA